MSERAAGGETCGARGRVRAPRREDAVRRVGSRRRERGERRRRRQHAQRAARLRRRALLGRELLPQRRDRVRRRHRLLIGARELERRARRADRARARAGRRRAAARLRCGADAARRAVREYRRDARVDRFVQRKVSLADRALGQRWRGGVELRHIEQTKFERNEARLAGLPARANRFDDLSKRLTLCVMVGFWHIKR